MKKLAILGLSAVLGSMAFVGCNSDSEPVTYSSSNVMISSFSFSADDSVLKNLDTVFFSIDLQRGRIFNADSLPFGTKINKLVPVIKVYQVASALTLTVPRANGTDTVYDYATNPNDTIDFSNGPVTIEVTSLTGSYKYKYTVNVNVHTVLSDSMVWTDAATAPLATTLSTPKVQKTVRNSNGLYTLTADGSRYSLMHAATPADEWVNIETELPASADVASFTASGNAFYILASGRLYSSVDARTWTETGLNWHYIYGDYNGSVVGSSNASGRWEVVRYPGDYAPAALPEGMPVSGTSETLSKSFDMSPLPQIMFVGGVKADGTLSNRTWAYDGSNWADVTAQPIPDALKDMTVVPFYTFYKNMSYAGARKSTILAYGGTDGKTNNRTVYMSVDFGMKWYKAPVTMQLPEDVPSVSDAQAYVFETTMGSRSASAWTPLALDYRIPASAVTTPWFDAVRGRATEPVTTWNVPYVYTFGGIRADGSLETAVWRATINRLSFKPII